MNRYLTLRAAWLAALVVVLSCHDRPSATAPLQRAATTPASDFLDGAHMGGNPHFYFLPPIVAKPRPTGTFDASLLGSLAVEVCELSAATATSAVSCGAQIARFNSSSGKDALRLVGGNHEEDEGANNNRDDGARDQQNHNADDDNPYYAVKWHTRRAGLKAGAYYRITALEGTSPLGFADFVVLPKDADGEDDGDGDNGAAPAVDRTRFFPLVNGRTLPIRFRVEQGAFTRIGGAGGTATALGGQVTVVIPPGAVTGTIDITAMPAALPPGTEQDVVPGSAIEMSPSGTQFAVPVQLSIRYDPAQLPSGVNESALRLAKLIDGVWVPVPGSTVDVATHTITGVTPSFSPYGGYIPCRISIVRCPGTIAVDDPVQVGRLLQREMHVSISPAAGPQGVRLTAMSWDPIAANVAQDANHAAMVAPQITIPEGASSASFYVQAEDISAFLGHAAISVSAISLGSSVRYNPSGSSVSVVDPNWQIAGLPATISTLANPQPFEVRIGIARPDNCDLAERQARRFGSVPLQVAVKSDPSSVASISGTRTTASGDAAADILATQDHVGFALQPLAAGGADVWAEIAGFGGIGGISPCALPSRQHVVVEAPPVDAGPALTVGSALEKETTGSLAVASRRLPVTVTLTSSDPRLAIVAPNLTTRGAGTITVDVPAGETRFSYVVQAGITGNVTITASAAHHSDGQTTVAIVTPGVQLMPSPSWIPPWVLTTKSAPQDFQVVVGIPDARNEKLLDEQRLRAGSAALTATLSSSIPAVAKVLTTGQTFTVQIQQAQSRSPATLNGDGAAIAPFTLGTTMVAAQIPGFVMTLADSPSVHVIAPFSSVSAGGDHTCAISGRNNLWCWGDNRFGQLGDGTTTDRTAPTLVPNRSFSAVGAGANHTCASTTAQDLYCWGSNYYGQLGINSTTDALTPARTFGEHKFSSVSGGLWTSCGLTPLGDGYCWGENSTGAVGTASPGDTCNGLPCFQTPLLVSSNFSSIRTGFQSSCALTPSRTALCWGSNEFGKLGDNTRTNRYSPTPVYGGLNFQSISVGGGHACGITDAGAAYCWGRNEYGQLGNGAIISSNAPVAVAGGLSFVAITAATWSGGLSHTCAIATDGKAYCWGDNRYGQLGATATQGCGPIPGPCSTTPLPVAGGLAFTAITTGDFHTCALTTSGDVYCWGNNASGQLGDGTLTSRRDPAPIIP